MRSTLRQSWPPQHRAGYQEWASARGGPETNVPSAKATPADKESATIVPAFMVPNPLGFHTLPYWRFDALAEYQLNKSISMQLNVVNLTNEL